MRKGNTKKTNFTKIARRALASALSLSMVLGVNIVPAGAAEAKTGEAASAPVVTGAAVDFGADGVILSSGNAATIDGTTLTLGAPITDAAAGVEIVNPFVSDAALTSETLADALVRTGGDNNFFIFRYPNTSTAFAIDSALDKFYVAPFASVEAAQLAASNGSVTIVESLDELTYATRAATNANLKSEDMNFDPTKPETAATKIVAARLDQLKKNKVDKKIIYKDADGFYTTAKNKDKFTVKTLEQAVSDGDITEEQAKKARDASTETETFTHVCAFVKGTEEQAMQNWDPNNYKPVIMNLAQANGTGTSSTAVNVVEPTWENGVSVSMWVKAVSDIPTPIFVFSNRNDRYKAKGTFGGLVFYTDGTFIYSEDGANGSNGMKQNVYSATFLNTSTPINNLNKWVYVTVNIKNDGAEVYYNGQKCATPKMNYANKDSNSKYFNYSYGFQETDRTKICLEQGSRHAQRLRNVTNDGIVNFSWKVCSEEGITAEQYFAAEDGGFGYYKYYDSNGAATHNIMEYITEPECKLYIGGDDGKGFVNVNAYCEKITDSKGSHVYKAGTQFLSYVYGNDWSKITQNESVAEGTMVKNVVFDDSVATAGDVKNAYIASTIAVSDATTDEVTDAAALTSYDYTLDENEKATGVAATNDAYNDASFSKDEFDNTTIVLGATTDEGSPRGVQLVNPYSGKKELVETVSSALQRTGLTLDAWTYRNKDGENYYYRVGDKASKIEAQAQYNVKFEENQAQYGRTQVWEYAKATLATQAIVTKDVVSGGATDIVTEAAAGGVTCTVADVVLANAQATADSRASEYANLNNFWKKYNTNVFTNEQVIGWAMGNIESVEACVAANKLGQTYDEKYPMYATTANPANTSDVYSYPYPTWNTGVTFSTWVKAATDASATVLEFTDGVASLNLSSTGKLVFQAGTSGNAKKNTYQATFDGATPAKNVGEWVYVTIKVKNDNIEVYYNGEKATKTMNKAQKDSNYFNYGTGYAEDNTATRIATMVKENGFMDILKGFGDTTDYSDFTKYTMRNADGANGVENIMKFLTSIDTQLFLGGKSDLAKYTDVNEGMEFGTISFYDVLVADETIADQYTAAKELRETSKSGNVSGDPVNPSGTPVEPSGTPVEPSGTPVEPSGTPVEPSGTPVKPSDKPVEPSGTPVKPSDKPVDPLEANFKAGDADCNKKVDLNDAKLVLKLALGIKADVTKQGEKNADYDKSGKVDLNDAKYTLKDALGIKFTIK